MAKKIVKGNKKSIAKQKPLSKSTKVTLRVSEWLNWHTTASHVDSVADADMITKLMLTDSYLQL